MPRPNLYWLLALVPISLAAELVWRSPLLVFLTSALAIIPLAGLLGKGTEELALHAGPRVGGLMNASLGNLAEFIIALFLILDGELEVAKASLTGSVLGNLLLVLGLSFLLGGLRRQEQTFNARAAGVHVASLILALIGLFIPALTVLGLGADAATFVQREVVSSVVSVVLIVLYGLALAFMLVTHEPLFRVPQPDEEPTWSRRKALGVLVTSVAVVAIESELLVGSLESAIEGLGVSKIFIGLIVVAVVGNAAEHGSAVLFAIQDKVDISLEIAVGSSTQVALLLAPALVLLSLLLGHPMDLLFTPFELAAVGFSTLIVAVIALDGRSNWLEGAQLVGAYLIMAISFLFIGG